MCRSEAQAELQSKCVAGGQQRFSGRNRLLCVTAGSLPCLLAVWVLNCVFASPMAPGEHVRCWVSLPSGQEDLWRRAGWDIPPSQRGFSGWGRLDSRGISKGELGQSPGALGAASLAFRKGFKLWLGVGRLERAKGTVKSPESKFLVFTCPFFAGGSSSNSGETAATTTAEWHWIQAAAGKLKPCLEPCVRWGQTTALQMRDQVWYPP